MQNTNELQSPLFRLFFIITLVLFTAVTGWSATISKVKGKTVAIDLEGASAKKGDVFVAIDGGGKKKGIVRISQVKGTKALGRIVKGSAKTGWELRSRDEIVSQSKKSTGSSSSKKSYSGKKSKFSAGLLVGLNMNSMTAKVNAGATTASMSGSGTAFGLMSDINLNEKFSVRASFGFDTFKAEGEVTNLSCTGSNTCTASIKYLVISAIGRYSFGSGMFRGWAGLGGSLLNPSSPESTAIDIDSISTSSAIIVGGGADIWINDKIYIPVQATYNLLPSSDNVTAKYIAIRAGAAYNF